MFDIKATFENGEVQHFGDPKVLYHYMQDKRHTSVKIESSYCLIRLPKMTMDLADVADWASHGGTDSIELSQPEIVAPVQRDKAMHQNKAYMVFLSGEAEYPVAIFASEKEAHDYCSAREWQFTDENGDVWELDYEIVEKTGT